MKKIIAIGSEQVGKYEYIALKVKKRALEEESGVVVVETNQMIQNILQDNGVQVQRRIEGDTIVVIEMSGENDKAAFRMENIEQAKELYLLFSDDAALPQLKSWIDISDDIYVFQIQNEKTLAFATLLHVSEDTLKRIPKYESIHIKTNH